MQVSLRTIEAIFHQALQLPADERIAYLDSTCGENSELRQEVESLLAHKGEWTANLEAALQPVAAELLSSGSRRPTLPIGTMLGPYRVDQQLGQGGMGEVYLATDTRLARNVAVKVMSGLAASEEGKSRIFREARAAAALSHTNIATLHDLGDSGDLPWLVMEYVPGASLRARLSTPLDEELCLRYAVQIASALAHAHSRGLVHRDIKPENILITGGEHIKVIDFGLARAFSEPSSKLGTLTDPNAFIGTLAYSAPEIIAGGSATPRSDVYSLGVVLYEMACGRQPFAGLTGHTLVAAILSGSYPPCAAARATIPPWIASIIVRAMSREPAMRFRDASELGEALRSPDQQPEVETVPVPPTIAILDFRNIGVSADLEWLGAGIDETLSADLARIKSVRVISRSRIMQTLRSLGVASDDATAALGLGRELSARWVVTGGYQKAGENIRVTAGLVDVLSGDTIASEKIDGGWNELFKVQDRVVAAILNTLTIGLGAASEQKVLVGETRSLAAYEHYVRARQEMYEMQNRSLAAAIHHFEQAVALDPDYAIAYSGLGTAHALQFISASNPEDIQRASKYLERSIELDPELGEPYPWLANIRIRKNDAAGAFAAARRGVELQPDLPESHYFFSGAHYMLPEWQPGALRITPLHLAEAIRLQPRFHASWLVLGATAVFLGKHAEAVRILSEAVRMETEPEIIYRFVGARTLLAIAHMRQGSWNEARNHHLEALELLRNNDHVYTTSFQILSACGMGDIELRSGSASVALQHYRHAYRILKESPRTIGGARLRIRIDTGLAAAYAGTGEVSRARELINAAVQAMDSLAQQFATVNFECSLAQLWLSLAAAYLRVGEIDMASGCLARASEAGWSDLIWLSSDPELRSLHNDARFLQFVKKLTLSPAVEVPVPVRRGQYAIHDSSPHSRSRS
jgi:serine/threonine protein kinase/cytochrome c-type biogenesis protein CcmH/NrfG